MHYTPVSRRAFIKATGLIGMASSSVYLQACSSNTGSFALSLYLTIENQKLVFTLPRSEMGQDITTSFAMLIAEELDYPLDKLTVRYAGASEEIPHQMTVGSSSIRTWWQAMRQLGANTKALIVQQAAKQHAQDPSDITAHQGRLTNASGSLNIPFEQALASITVPQSIENAPLKSREQFKLIGRAQPSLFNREKVTGQYQYLTDHKSAPSSLTIASVAYKAHYNLPNDAELARVKNQYGLTQAFAAKANDGIYAHYVFLCHHKTWPLLQAKQQLEKHKHKQAENHEVANSAFEQALEQAPPAAISQEAITLAFVTPPITHSPMEPPCASMRYQPEQTEVWAPTQAPDIARKAVAQALDVNSNRVTLHTMPMGGAFGRKRYADYLQELALAAKALYAKGIQQRLTLIWTREDDLEREHYRPATLQTASWENSAPNQIHLSVKEGYAGANATQAQPLHCDLPTSLQVNATKSALNHHFKSGIWRAVHHGYHAFALCSLIDEISRQNQSNTLDYYLQHLPHTGLKERAKNLIKGRADLDSRMHSIIMRVAAMANWQAKAENEAAQGFAAYSVFGSHIALIAKVRINNKQELEVEQIWASVDCGQAINPDKLKAQIAGGILYALSACLYGEIPREKEATTLNFDTQRVLRMSETPVIEVDIQDSEEAPTGAGELGVPAVAPAICNAIRTLTGHRVTKLPLIKQGKINYDNAVQVSTVEPA